MQPSELGCFLTEKVSWDGVSRARDRYLKHLAEMIAVSIAIYKLTLFLAAEDISFIYAFIHNNSLNNRAHA